MAARIVAELAEANTTEWIDDYFVCMLCCGVHPLGSDTGDFTHDDDCPWLLAKQWVGRTRKKAKE